MARSKPRNKEIPRPPRPVIPMKPKPDKPKPPRSALEEIEKHFGPVKWAEPEKAKKDSLSGLTSEYGTKSLLKGMLKFFR